LLTRYTATAQQQFVVKPIAEKKLKQLPAGPLYWRVENLPTLAKAQAAERPTSLTAEVAARFGFSRLVPRWFDARRKQGRRDRTRASDQRAGVSATY
jgi:hypothetical protein